MFRDPSEKSIVKCTFLLALLFMACRLSYGYAAVGIVFMGIVWAMQNKVGLALACFVLCPFMIVVNPLILPKASFMGMVLRIGPLVMGLLLMLSATRRKGSHVVPLTGLVLYFVCAFVSSIGGYCFKISLLKLINIGVYVIAIIVGTRNLFAHPQEIAKLRIFFMALCVLSIAGSFLTLPFPAVAYPLASRWLMTGEGGVSLEEANEIMRSSEQGMSLFAGFFMHSQTAAPIFACIFTYVFCDMIEYKRKYSSLHGLLILGSLVGLFMTRSRTGLLAFMTGVGLIVFYMKDKVPLPSRFKVKLRSAINAALVLMVLGGVALEIKSQTFSRWILKTDDLAESSASGMSVVDRVTASRQGLIEKNLDDFRKNPFLGMGFQVDQNSVYFAGRGLLVLSAPIEKGVLPLMVLGEGGVLGGIVFFATIITFSLTCIRKKYLATLSLMTCFLATNLGEATFFSPGGVGGILWAYCCVGGFSLDMLAVAQNRQQFHESAMGFR